MSNNTTHALVRLLWFSVFPPFAVSLCHLWLQQPSKCPIYSPPNAITLLNSTLNYKLIPRQTMNIDPHTLPHHFVKLLLSLFILHELCPPGLSPKLLTTPMSMLTPSSSPDWQLRQIVCIVAHKLLWTQYNVWFVKSILHLLDWGPWYLLARGGFTHS